MRRAVDPSWRRTYEAELLRQVEYWTRLTVSALSPKSRIPGGLVPMPWDDDPEGTIRGDAMTIDEANGFLAGFH